MVAGAWSATRTFRAGATQLGRQLDSFRAWMGGLPVLITSDRKKPGVAFWATVTMVVLVVLYPLSIGPVIWLVDREMLPERFAEPVAVFYFPLEWAVGSSDATAQIYAWYARLWMRERPAPFF